jgi:hypothetical protein
MVRAGVDAYKAGNKAEARTLLERAIELDSYNETAWLWLSAVVDTPEEQQTCLENVLVINPKNSRARQGLKSLGIDPDSVVEQPNAPAFEEGSFDEYAVPSSSASVGYSGPQTSGDEYDSWVDGLNLGNKPNAAKDTAAPQDLFGDVDFSDDGGAFDLDDNIFSEDAYTGYTNDAIAGDIDYIDDDLYDDDDLFDDGDDMFADIGTLEDFDGAVDDIDDYDPSEFSSGDPFAAPPAKPVVEAAPQLSTQDLFSSIPKEIEATRAPGVSESASIIHYVLLGILALVNIGALTFIGFQFVA